MMYRTGWTLGTKLHDFILFQEIKATCIIWLVFRELIEQLDRYMFHIPFKL